MMYCGICLVGEFACAIEDDSLQCSYKACSLEVYVNDGIPSLQAHELDALTFAGGSCAILELGWIT